MEFFQAVPSNCRITILSSVILIILFGKDVLLRPHPAIELVGAQKNDTGEDNADAHIKRQVLGQQVVVAITKGEFDFGRWEQIFYGEFDGRRKKRVLVKIIGEC